MTAMRTILALCLSLVWGLTQAAAPRWQAALQERLSDIESQFPGEIGVYAQHLETGSVLSWRGAETWYLASMIKVPVAIELFARVDQGEMRLEDEIELRNDDYVDGAGQTNWQPPGSRLSLGYLLEQMLTVSDNTATDLLIRHLGLDNVNRRAQGLLPANVEPDALGPITTLVDVRRRAYGFLHPRAAELTGLDYLALRQVVEPAQRVEAFARKLGVARDELRAPSLESAFEAYYATPYNSGRLDAFAELLVSAADGAALSQESSQALLAIMYRTRSGDRRIKAGLPDSHRFAHKTGTQLRRACDGGLISEQSNAQARPIAVVVACTRGAALPQRAESALAEVGRALAASGLLEAQPAAQ